MNGKRPNGMRIRGQQTAVRATISFPLGIYESLDIIATEKRVSLAWVARDEAQRYIGKVAAVPWGGKGG